MVFWEDDNDGGRTPSWVYIVAIILAIVILVITPLALLLFFTWRKRRQARKMPPLGVWRGYPPGYPPGATDASRGCGVGHAGARDDHDAYRHTGHGGAHSAGWFRVDDDGASVASSVTAVAKE